MLSLRQTAATQSRSLSLATASLRHLVASAVLPAVSLQSDGCSHTSANSQQLARDHHALNELTRSRTNVTLMANAVAQRWADDLASWGIPDHILSAAPQSPWIHPVSSFTPDGDLFVDTPSRHRALDALDGIDSPSVLDVGCGGGRGVFGLTPPATHVVGVDQQQEMLDVVNTQAADRGLSAATVLGNLPAVIGAGFGIGLFEKYTGAILGTAYEVAAPVSILLLVLIWRQIQMRRNRQVVR